VAGKALAVDLHRPEKGIVKAVSSVLLHGGIAVYPSDTVYGLLSDARCEAACLRIALLKGYAAGRPFIVLVDGIDTALLLASGTGVRELMERYWPGPVTLILKASAAVPEWLVSDRGAVALRYPADPLTKSLLGATSSELVSTSANLMNDPAPLRFDDISQSITEGADIVLNGGLLAGRTPSRIIDLTGDKPSTVR